MAALVAPFAASRSLAKRPMLAWWLVMVSLPAEEALLLLPLVCRDLRAIGEDLALLAALLGCAPGRPDAAGAASVAAREVLRAYPSGRFLAEGGCKRVYRAFNAGARRWEAMSVVDRLALREKGIQSQLQNAQKSK